ncbi:hypothetical protein PFISCL1PPCAC_13052, partial [Pristionchus fissidentatus]
LLREMIVNESLRFGFDYDRIILLDVIVSVQIILPIITTLFVHPLVICMLNQQKTMRSDIRLGYYSTTAVLWLTDWIVFGLRGYCLSPYAAYYCDGPLCYRLGMPALMALLSFTVTLHLPCYMFLVVRMHQAVLRGSGSKWILSTR